jgi:hypothetical protein
MSIMVTLLGALGSAALAQDASPAATTSPAAASPTDSNPTAASPALTAAPTANASPSPVTAETWVTAALPPVSGDASHPRAVASDGAGQVAVGGAACAAETACPGEAWSSPDGLTWTAIGSDAGLDLAADEGGQLGLVDVAFGPGGYVAVGQPAALWRSADGQTWERVGQDLAFGPNTTLTAIAASPDGYLVVGASHGAKQARAVGWRSTDAMSWTAVADSKALKVGVVVDLGGGMVGSGGMTAVVRSADGYIASGGICRPPKSGGEEEAVALVSGVRTAEVQAKSVCRPAVWRSADGQAWERQVLGKAPRLAVTGEVMGLRGLAVLGDVAVVAETGPTGPILGVLGGPSAKRVDLMRQEDVETLWALGTIGDRFLAVGIPLRGAFGMWTSADGVEWRPLADVPALPADANVITGADIGASAGGSVIVGSAVETYEGGAEVGFSVVSVLEASPDTTP